MVGFAGGWLAQCTSGHALTFREVTAAPPATTTHAQMVLSRAAGPGKEPAHSPLDGHDTATGDDLAGALRCARLSRSLTRRAAGAAGIPTSRRRRIRACD